MVVTPEQIEAALPAMREWLCREEAFPSLSLSQIDWLIELAECTGWLTANGKRLQRESLVTLRALRAELTREDGTE